MGHISLTRSGHKWFMLADVPKPGRSLAKLKAPRVYWIEERLLHPRAVSVSAWRRAHAMPTTESNSTPATPGSSLLAGLKGQQPEAWQRFLRLYGPLLYSWCRRRWQLPAQDSADVVQEIVVKVMQALPKFRGGNFVAWLAKVTRSQVVRHFQQTP